jgi:hypothetical protein
MPGRAHFMPDQIETRNNSSDTYDIFGVREVKVLRFIDEFSSRKTYRRRIGRKKGEA